MPRRKPEDLAPQPVISTGPSVTYNDIEQQKHDVEITTNGDGSTKKVKLDLEIDTSSKDLGPNPYVKFIHLARAIDSWRIFPRVFISVYILLLYQVSHWFMNLSDPNTQQASLVSIVIGAGAAWFGLYVGSGKATRT